MVLLLSWERADLLVGCECWGGRGQRAGRDLGFILPTGGSNPWYQEDEHSTLMLFPLEPSLRAKRDLEMLLYVH